MVGRDTLRDDGEEAGVSLWRQVSEKLARDIESGRFRTDERLPASADLAKRFKVNRHTVLKAIAHLQSRGALRMERGRGSFAVVNPVAFRLGPQQWFELNLRNSNLTASRTILAVEEIPASAEIATALELDPESPVLFATIVGEADGLPMNYGHHYFPVSRLPALRKALKASGHTPSKTFSFSALFKSVGITDWRRRSIRIRGRLPTREETTHLKISPSDVVLVTSVISVDKRGVPIVFAKTSYGASRTELLIDL